jgi:LacI family transcriptional regulator
VRFKVDVSSKMPSIRAVASRAGVSTATVSNVLNARRSVAPDLAARVHAAVKEIGYIADLGASRLRSRKSSVAGVLVPDLGNPFFGSFVAVLEGAARCDGYELMIVSSGDDPVQEEARLRTLLTWRPAGVIVIPCRNDLAGSEVAAAAGVPLVVADRIPANVTTDVVGVDNQRAAADVVRHLIANGRRHILVAVANMGISNVQERCAGIQAAAAQGGAEVEILEVGFTLTDSRARLIERLAAPVLPQALFTLNNVATLGAIGALAASGLHVPHDIALVGFDDEEWMRVVSPPLTAVRQPIEDMAQAAWSRLMARIGGDTSPPHEVRLACTLEARDSSAPVIRPIEPAASRRWAQ